MKKTKKSSKFGIAKFLVIALVLGGGLVYGTQMVQKSQENRSKATSESTVYKTNEYSGGTNKKCSNISGKCGDFDTVLSAGTSCEVGSVTGIIYSGKCDGGSKVKCCAPKSSTKTSTSTSNKPKVNGQCGSSKNMCVKGSSRDTADTPGYYQWKCDGQYGGSTANCSCDKKKCK